MGRGIALVLSAGCRRGSTAESGAAAIGRRFLQQVTKACKAVRRVVQVAADKMPPSLLEQFRHGHDRKWAYGDAESLY